MKRNIRKGIVGEGESSRKMQVSQMLSHCPASRPGTSGTGKKAGKGRAEPGGQRLAISLGPPLPTPSPPSRTATPASLPSLARSGPPAARSHRSEPGGGQHPPDVTRGAAKGRGPCSPSQPLWRGSHAQCLSGRGRLASNQGEGVPKKVTQ